MIFNLTRVKYILNLTSATSVVNELANQKEVIENLG